MMPPRSYASPETFKQALEQRLKSSSKSGAEFARRRQLLVFARFLARIVATVGDAATLKGGLVLELRLDRARTTKDVDLRMLGSSGELLAKLQQAGRLDLGDFMAFEIVPDADHPEIRNDAVQYDGLRFRAECKLAGKVYGQPFGVDVAFSDPIIGPPDVVVAEKTCRISRSSRRPRPSTRNACAPRWSRRLPFARRIDCPHCCPHHSKRGARRTRRWRERTSSRGRRSTT